MGQAEDAVSQTTSAEGEASDWPPPAKDPWRSPVSWVVVGFLALQTVGLYLARRENAALRVEVGKRIPLTRSDFFVAASHLAPQYTRARARTGSWPRPEEVVKELPLLQSRRDERERCRVDIYRASTPSVTIHFRLGDDGSLSIRLEDRER